MSTEPIDPHAQRVALIATAIADLHGWEWDNLTYESKGEYRRYAGAALDALDEAGLLLPPTGEPRTWSLPPEPGPEVTAVREEPEDRIWLRHTNAAGDSWWYPSGGSPDDDGTDWDELVAGAWPDKLIDATEESA